MSRVKLPRLFVPNNPNYDLKNLNEFNLEKNEETVILEAIKVGYLVYPSERLVWDTFRKQIDFEKVVKAKFLQKEMITKKGNYSIERSLREFKEFIKKAYDFKMIDLLNLPNIPLIEIGEISLCKNLKILNLSNNYIFNIDALYPCVHLFKLDLQNNQVEHFCCCCHFT